MIIIIMKAKIEKTVPRIVEMYRGTVENATIPSIEYLIFRPRPDAVAIWEDLHSTFK